MAKGLLRRDAIGRDHVVKINTVLCAQCLVASLVTRAQREFFLWLASRNHVVKDLKRSTVSIVFEAKHGCWAGAGDL